MAAGDVLRYEELILVKDILSMMEKADQELEQAASALASERRRATTAPAGEIAADQTKPSGDGGGSGSRPIKSEVESKSHDLEAENQNLNQRVAQLQSQLQQEVRRRDEEVARVKTSALAALRRGFVDTLQVLGGEDPWAANAELRRLQGDLQQRLRERESQLGVSRAELQRVQEELKRLEGSREAQRADCERMRQQISTLPEQTRGDIFKALLNKLDISKMAALLAEPEGGTASLPDNATRQLLGWLAGYLRDEGVVVTDWPGQIVYLGSEANLAQYGIPPDEQFHPGTARVTLPGVAYREQVIIKASVRYVEEEHDEHRPDNKPGGEDGFGSEGETRRSEGAETSRRQPFSAGNPVTAIPEGGARAADGKGDGGPIVAEQQALGASTEHEHASEPEAAAGSGDTTSE